MRISDVLQSMATWLENPNNEAILVSEKNDECLAVVAAYCVEAAEILKKAAQEVELIEPKETLLNDAGLDELGALADALDSSGDPALMKQASLIDELLISVSAPKNAFNDKTAKDENKIKELHDEFHGISDKLHEVNKTADLGDAIKEHTKNYNNLEAPLSTRYCPDHPGVNMYKVEDNIWQCEMDKKQYNFESGFTLMNGSHVPGGDVSNQTEYFLPNEYSQFDTREGRLGSNKA